MRRGSKKNRLADVWIGIPLLNLLATFRRKKPFPSCVDRIGLICSFALGDTLLFSAAVRSIRQQYPSQRLLLFCGRQNVAAAELIPGIDQIVVVDLLRPLETINAIRSRRVDLLLDFTPWQRLTALYTLLSGAHFTAGFRSPGQRRHRGFDLTVPHRRDRHELQNFQSLVQAVGISALFPPAVDPPAVPSPPLLERAGRIVVFHPWPSGVRSQTREWPQERWVEFAKRWTELQRGLDLTFVVTGSPSDSPRSVALVSTLRAESLDAHAFVGTDGLASLCHLIRSAGLVVSVNTGVMHLAAILGAPTISLNGPTSNVRWGPIGPRAIGVQPEGPGCGYLHFGFEHSAGPTDCMQRITTEMVLTAAHQVWSK